ncbi:MAG: hypothetical protein ACO34E_16845 [Limisphaerales bacterium]
MPKADANHLKILEFPEDQTRRAATAITRLLQDSTPDKTLPLLPPDLQTNVFTGQPLRLEDSPGNYTLKITPHHPKLLWYDANGAPHKVQKETDP